MGAKPSVNQIYLLLKINGKEECLVGVALKDDMWWSKQAKESTIYLWNPAEAETGVGGGGNFLQKKTYIVSPLVKQI